jgi:glycosyltransferase involved in cell wall biosynthesis
LVGGYSVAHLVAGTAADVTVLGSSASVVERVAAGRPAYVAPLRDHPRLLARLRPDVVHANLAVPWAGSVGLAASFALPRTRTLAVEQLPLRTTRLPEWLRTRMIALRLDAHVAVGEAGARRVEDFMRSVAAASAASATWCPTPVSGRWEHEGFVVGAVGRLDGMKDHALLVRAAARAGARVVVVGEGGGREGLLRLAASLEVPLELPGWTDDPWRPLAAADVVVLPSRSEGWPLSLVEAMLAGRPVVATRVGSVPEIVRDGETGLLVDSGDIRALADALSMLRDDPGRRARLGAAARARATARLTVGHMVAAYEALWDELLSAHRAPRLLVPRPRG